MTQSASPHDGPYTSIGALDLALASAESTSRLVEWLLGDDGRRTSSDANDGGGDRHSKGLTQGNASLLLLRAIRDACQRYLDDAPNAGGTSSSTSGTAHTRTHLREAAVPSTTTTPAKPERQAAKSEPTYEEAFPSLSASNTVTPTKAPTSHVATKAKAKRRIRPATLSTSTGSHHSGNLVHAPSLNEPGIAGPVPIVHGVRNAAGGASSEAGRVVGTVGPSDAARTPHKSWGPAKEVTPRKEMIQQPPQNPVTDSPAKVGAAAADSGVDAVEFTNLVSVYCALIRGCLVPSTALEVHFLIRLLVAPTNLPIAGPSTVAETDPSVVHVHNALSSSTQCRTFALKCLTDLGSLITKRLGSRSLLKDIIQCPPIRQNCPELVKQLQIELDRVDGSVLGGSEKAHLANAIPKLMTSHVAHWTIPFHEERDSRHRFRSRDEMVIYKNREETKDAFLHQLRNFLSSHGKVVDRAQKVRQLENMKVAFRDMVGKLNSSNLAWFAERLFRDLLLQIGLVPVEETDTEVLKLTDQVKLQKLHQRFTSKHPQQRGSRGHSNYTNGTTDPNQDLTSPATEARAHFPGHQDFFYMFLLSVDSQRLSAHLTATLAKTLTDLCSHVDPNSDVEKRCLEMCMVARFLGVLVFSPNWQSASVSPDLHVQSGYNGLAQLASVGLPIAGMIVDAYNHRRLTAVVPWIVDLLKLAKRDPVSRASPAYSEVVRLLREIQLTLMKDGDDYDGCAPVVVSLSLEALMGEVVGLARLPELVDAPMLAERPSVSGNDALDLSCATFSLQSLVTMNSNVHELSDLVSRLSKVDLSAQRGSVRKLRPSVLSSPGMSVMSSPSPAEPAKERHPSPSVKLTGTSNTIQSKLVETFFHQHRDLKDLCEFAAARALPIALASSLASGDELWCSAAAATDPLPRSEALSRFQSSVETKLKECIGLALKALVSPTSPGSSPRAVDMAVELTVGHILRSNEELIKKKVDERYEEILAKAEAGTTSKRLFPGTSDGGTNTSKGDRITNATERKELANSRLRDLTSSLQELTSLLRSGMPSDGVVTAVAASLDVVVSRLQSIENDKNHHVPAQEALRPFFEAVMGLDETSGVVLDWCVPSDADVVSIHDDAKDAISRWNTLQALVRIELGLRRTLSARGLPRVRQILAQPARLARLVSLGLSESPPQLTTLLRNMVDSRAITVEDVREAGRNEGQFSNTDAVTAYADEFVETFGGGAAPLSYSSYSRQ